MSGNPLVRFDEGRVGRTSVPPSLLLYRETSDFADPAHILRPPAPGRGSPKLLIGRDQRTVKKPCQRKVQAVIDRRVQRASQFESGGQQ